MMGSHRLLQFRSNNVTGTFGGRATGEDHNTSTSILERSLQETNSNAQSNASTSQGSSIVSNRPRVMLQLLKDVRDLEFRLLNGKQESGRRWVWPDRLLRHGLTNGRSKKSKHLLDLFRSIFLAASKDIGLCALRVANLMDLGLKSH